MWKFSCLCMCLIVSETGIAVFVMDSYLTNVHGIGLSLYMRWNISNQCVLVHFIFSFLSVQSLSTWRYLTCSQSHTWRNSNLFYQLSPKSMHRFIKRIINSGIKFRHTSRTSLLLILAWTISGVSSTLVNFRALASCLYLFWNKHSTWQRFISCCEM